MIERVFYIFKSIHMWRGPVVARKRDAGNAAKQKIYSIHAKLISMAAKSWADPNLNPTLWDAVEKAKKANVPSENIARAIKRGSGQDKDAAEILSITYEGYAPGGVALLVTTLTDNKNRTASEMRHIFSKYGGNLGEPGSVAYQFEKKGIFMIDLGIHDALTLEELMFETEVEDFFQEDGMMKVLTESTDFWVVMKFFQEKNIVLEFAEIDFIPSTTIDITDFDQALKITKLLDALHDDEDVQKVSANMNIAPELQKKVHDFIEENTFKT